MLARLCTFDDLYSALALVNKKYAGNIRFYEDPTRFGKGFRFRLKVNNPREIGVARSASGKHTGSGCWHAHGDFFEALIKVQPDVAIESRGHLSKITRHGGNWQDYNVGSQAIPLYASDACDCAFSKEITGHLSGEKEMAAAIQLMNAERIEQLIGYWGRDEFIISHCAKDILPLYLNEEHLKKIVCKRLGRMAA
jgi:hypothetical protein